MLNVAPAVTAEEAVINQKEPPPLVSNADRCRPAAPDGSLSLASPSLSQPLQLKTEFSQGASRGASAGIILPREPSLPHP